MERILNFVTWAPNPDIINDPIRVRWYGLLFASGFILGYYVVRRIFRKEGIKEEWLDKLLLYVMLGTVIGARLGHVFFYGPYWGPNGYLENPINIIKVWEGGLASHGAAIGIIISLFLYSRFVTKRNILWSLDRVVIPTALGGMFIRLGNLMNSEIAGKITDNKTLGWHFPRYIGPEGSKYQGITDEQLSQSLGESVLRYPTQIYEALAYLGIFLFLRWLYWKKNAGEKQGFLFGAFLTTVFSVRVLVEFIKENQDAADQSYLLNMGQMLSLPLVAIGIFFIWWSNRKSTVSDLRES